MPASDAIRSLRAARGLSLSEAARIVEISKSTLSGWESGVQVPHGSNLETFLRKLDATPAERAALLAPPPDPVPLGEALLGLRLRKGLPQKSIALSLGVTQTTVSRWEAGLVRPPEEMLIRLLRGLGASEQERDYLTHPTKEGRGALDTRKAPSFAELFPASHREHESTRALRMLSCVQTAQQRRALDPSWEDLLKDLQVAYATALMDMGRAAEFHMFTRRALASSARADRSDTRIQFLMIAHVLSGGGRARIVDRMVDWSRWFHPSLVAWCLLTAAGKTKRPGKAIGIMDELLPRLPDLPFHHPMIVTAARRLLNLGEPLRSLRLLSSYEQRYWLAASPQDPCSGIFYHEQAFALAALGARRDAEALIAKGEEYMAQRANEANQDRVAAAVGFVGPHRQRLGI